MIQPGSESSNSLITSPDIDLKGIGLAAIVIAERARQGITTPFEMKLELIQLINDQRSRTDRGRHGE